MKEQAGAVGQVKLARINTSSQQARNHMIKSPDLFSCERSILFFGAGQMGQGTGQNDSSGLRQGFQNGVYAIPGDAEPAHPCVEIQVDPDLIFSFGRRSFKADDSFGRMDGWGETPSQRFTFLSGPNTSQHQYFGRDAGVAQSHPLLDRRDSKDLGAGAKQCSSNRHGPMPISIGLDDGNQAIADCGLRIADWLEERTEGPVIFDQSAKINFSPGERSHD
jgi:hypothetical protein